MKNRDAVTTSVTSRQNWGDKKTVLLDAILISVCNCDEYVKFGTDRIIGKRPDINCDNLTLCLGGDRVYHQNRHLLILNSAKPLDIG